MCGAFPGGGGSSFYPETFNTSEGLHHCRQFSFGSNDLGCSHLVSVEGKYFVTQIIISADNINQEVSVGL